VLWLILLTIGTCLSGAVSGLCLYAYSKHLRKCSTRAVKREIRDEIADLEHWKKAIESEWGDVYDKFRSMLGRADRRMRKDRPLSPGEISSGQGGEDPQAARAAIMNYAKQNGLLR